MIIQLLRTITGPDVHLYPGIHDLPEPMALELIEAGAAKRVGEQIETATVEAPENAAKVTARRRPRKQRVIKH